MRLPVLLAAALLCAVSAASAQPQGAPADADVRINQLIIYGDDECPPSTGDEIIVCARLPDDERYRVPSELRDDPNNPVNRSWTNNAIELSYVGRTGIGSCSPVGPGGMIGCQEQLIRQARAERAGGVDWHAMIEEARQERLDRIDAEARGDE